MSVLGECPTDPSFLFCNRCRRMFNVDCTNVAISDSLLKSTDSSNRAEALRKRSQRQKQAANPDDPNSNASSLATVCPLGVAIPFGALMNQFLAVEANSASPWRAVSPGAATLMTNQKALPRGYASLSQTVATHPQWTSPFVERQHASHTLRLVVSSEDCAEPGTVSVGDASCAAPDCSPLMKNLIAKQKPGGGGGATDGEVSRPRGGIADSLPPLGPPTINKAILLQAAWDMLRSTGKEARIDLPLCLSCWREANVQLQAEANRLQSDAALLQRYTTLSGDELSMCFKHQQSILSNSAPECRVDGITTRTRHVVDDVVHAMLQEDGQAVLAELEDLYRQEEVLLRHLAEIEQEERILAAKEEEVAAETNAFLLRQFYEVDRRSMVLEAQLRLEAEVDAVKDAMLLREVFVIELDHPPIPPGTSSSGMKLFTFGRINGLRIGKVGTYISPGGVGEPLSRYRLVPAAAAASDAAGQREPIADSRRPATVLRSSPIFSRDVARLATNGVPYFCETFANYHHLVTSPSNSSTQSNLSYSQSPISIQEVNGACGYLALALKCLTQRNKLTLKACTIKPNASESTIEVSDPSRKSRNGQLAVETFDFFIVDRFFAWKTFGNAWVAYAKGLREVIKFLENAIECRLQARQEVPTGESSCLLAAPFAIELDGSMVGSYPIKHGSVSEEVWAKGVRCVLSNLDWCFVAQTFLEELQEIR